MPALQQLMSVQGVCWRWVRQGFCHCIPPAQQLDGLGHSAVLHDHCTAGAGRKQAAQNWRSDVLLIQMAVVQVGLPLLEATVLAFLGCALVPAVVIAQLQKRLHVPG